MPMDANVAIPAALIADPARAAILMALMDGRAQPAGALAYAANLSPQAASNHLAKLLDGGMVTVESTGRHRYYRLAGSEVAAVLEALQSMAPRVRPLDEPRSPEALRLRAARSCYDHLAGRLGVAVAQAMEARGLLSFAANAPTAKFCDLTEAGRYWFAELGIDVAAIRASRKPQARRCLDWTERRHHLAGPLGTALLARMVELGWIARAPGTRAVTVTAAGVRGLKQSLGLDWDAAATAQAA
jgi:DNA-binding transcriptional ArsR family regulator